MADRKSDEEILREWLDIEGSPYPTGDVKESMLRMVAQIRKHEPRINSGLHLMDFLNICDDDDDMDSFYGEDYFNVDLAEETK